LVEKIAIVESIDVGSIGVFVISGCPEIHTDDEVEILSLGQEIFSVAIDT